VALTTGEQLDSVWSGAGRLLTVSLAANVTLVAFENISVATVMPVIGRHLGDIRLYGWVFSAFLLCSLLGIVAAGHVADRGPVRLPLIGGLVFFAAGLLIAGSAPDMPVLVAGRAVQGFGAGVVPASAYVVIARRFAPAARPTIFAVLSSAWVVPGLIGPALAAQVATHVGWRWVFLGLLPLVAVAAILALVALPAGDGAGTPESERPRSSTPVVPALGVALGATALLSGLTLIRHPAAAALVIAGLLAGIAALRRLTPPGTLRARPGLPAAVGVRGLLTFAFFTGDAYVPLTVTAVKHQSTTYAGVTLTIATLTWTVAAWVQARVMVRTDGRPLIRAGLGLVALSLGGLAASLLPGVPAWAVTVAWSVAGFGIGLAYSPLSVSALAGAEPGREGEASSSVQLTDVLGTALGAGVGGAALTIGAAGGHPSTSGLAVAFGVAATVAVLAVAAARGVSTSSHTAVSPTPAENP
jgi:MFS family permease